MSEKETPFIEKTCPLLDRKCIREECVAFSEGGETYYVSNGSEELELMIPYKGGKRDKLLIYRIFEADIHEKKTVTRVYCKNYDKHHRSEETEEVSGEVFSHGEYPDNKYKGLWVQYTNHNKDSRTAIEGKWEYEHDV